MEKFVDAIEKRCQKSSVTIYPEAHIWPYYTKIRPFKDTSFSYPVEFNKPVFAMTNTYRSYGKNQNKVRIVTFIDGPYFADKTLNRKNAKLDLRNQIYNIMVERSAYNNIEYIKYVKK